MMVSL